MAGQWGKVIGAVLGEKVNRCIIAFVIVALVWAVCYVQVNRYQAIRGGIFILDRATGRVWVTRDLIKRGNRKEGDK